MSYLHRESTIQAPTSTDDINAQFKVIFLSDGMTMCVALFLELTKKE